MGDLPFSPAFTLLAILAALSVAALSLHLLVGLVRRDRRLGPATLRASLGLGSRERVAVVRWRDRSYLLGVTAERVRLLDGTSGGHRGEAAIRDGSSMTARAVPEGGSGGPDT